LAAETDVRAHKRLKCLAFFENMETPRRDRTGRLTAQSIANRSPPKFPANREKYREIAK
jgi:hypothetical protein